MSNSNLGPIGKLFSDASRWIKGAIARRSRRSTADICARSREATCWCLLGAIEKCYRTPGQQKIIRNAITRELEAKGYHGGIANWNDAQERRIGEVQELVERLGI